MCFLHLSRCQDWAGSGSGLLVFLRSSSGWRLPNWIWLEASSLLKGLEALCKAPGGTHKGDLTGWRFGLQSCLACRLRRVRRSHGPSSFYGDFHRLLLICKVERFICFWLLTCSLDCLQGLPNISQCCPKPYAPNHSAWRCLLDSRSFGKSSDIVTEIAMEMTHDRNRWTDSLPYPAQHQ